MSRKNNNIHPEHQFSYLIDSDFSFNNEVGNVKYPSKAETVNNLKNMRCDGTVMLEPRLQEYMKKKRYYKKNNITPCVSLEKEYQISSLDKRALRDFLSGRTDLYNTEPAKLENNVCKSDRSKSTKQYFPSKSFRDDDSRVPEISKNRNKQNNELPINRGMFFPNEDESYYDDPIKPTNPMMDSRDFVQDVNYNVGSKGGLNGGGSGSKLSEPDFYQGNQQRFDQVLDPEHSQNKQKQGFSLNDQRFDPRTDPYMDPGPENKNKYDSQYRVSQDIDPRKYGNDPRNKYIVSKLNNKEPEIKNNSGIQMTSGNNSYSNYPDYQNNDYNLVTDHDKQQFSRHNGYGQMDRQPFSEKSTMDLENKMVIPKMTNNLNKGLDHSSYRMMPYFRDPKEANKINIDTETSMIRGMPSHTTKSYGYRNPAEHHYQYIDPEFNNPENSVESWMRGGESTRRDNKSLAKQRAYREVM